MPDEFAATLPVNGIETQLKVVRWATLLNSALKPLQQTLADRDVFQCGYWTSGQVCLAAGIIAESDAKSIDELRELMSGNICRCPADLNILAVIQQRMGQP